MVLRGSCIARLRQAVSICWPNTSCVLKKMANCLVSVEVYVLLLGFSHDTQVHRFAGSQGEVLGRGCRSV